jgi:XTP/dITP diphosphohydrolase
MEQTVDADALKLLVATTNSGKLIELQGLLAGLSVNLVCLDELGRLKEVPETGATFEENAALKAAGYARQAGLLTLADDSGLEVKALRGRPGVHSARYGGKGISFADKMGLLLEELKNTGDPDRSARFVCAAVVAAPDGRILFAAEGICRGRIADRPRGKFGFGYDPIFVPEGYDQTFGELSVDIKQKISHRSRSFAQIIPFLRDFTAILT